MRFALLAMASSLLLAGGPPEAIGFRTALSAEPLRLPRREAMGLLGFSGTADFGPWYLGPGLYGAARGERGGFFTFGLEGGFRGRPFPAVALELEAGLFLGGGGGTGAPQGGGLMVRPHVGASLPWGPVRLGLGLSRVRFPNGGIDSSQAALTLTFVSSRLWTSEKGQGSAFEGPVRWADRGLELHITRVEPSASTRTRSGATRPGFDLAGIAATYGLQGPWFHFLAADGAAGGSSSGYAQALAGLGLRTPSAHRFGLEARLGAGLGGGGDVRTGGGLLISGEGAITFDLARWRGSAGLGFLRAPGGPFDSRTLTFRIARRTLAPIPSMDGEALLDFEAAAWRLGSGILLYRRAQRQDGTSGAIQLMTLRADRKLGPGFYVSGEAGSATGGGAGGYSSGQAGLGWETPLWAGQRLFAEGALGAGGGGGLRSGGGLLASLRTGWRLELPRGMGLEATIGRARAPRGGLETTTLGLGLQLRFKTPER